MDLVTLEEIKRVKYRYLRCVDQKRWDELSDTFAPDATASYGTPALGEHLSFTGRDAIMGFLRERLGNGIITVHFASQPEIDIDGDTAVGTWAFEDTIIVPEYRVLIRGAAFYEDRYRRCDDGGWRIQHTGYERTYEATLSLDDVPSFRLTANRWADSAAP
jgi:hypothetical protein